jgi:hypothetical protein
MPKFLAGIWATLQIQVVDLLQQEEVEYLKIPVNN